jgi:pSer/pThr/pTyr-binding forkhead associated (FHA) protein
VFTLTIEDKHGGVADEYSFEEGEFLIGRSHGADIILPSDNVSRRHARLYTVDGRCYLEDLGSANGVFVNGRRIHEVHEIESAAQVRVGDYYLHVKSDAAASVEDRVYCKLRGRNLSVVDQVFKLTRSVNLVGRGKDCTITIIDPSVSRIHGKLTVERNGGINVEDLKSSNGSFVNGERIEIASINHHDIVRFGNVEFVAEFPDLAPSDGGGSTGDLGLDEWEKPPASNTVLWLLVGVLSVILVAGGLLFAVFYDSIVGPDPERPSQQSLVEEEQEETDRKLKKEIEALAEEGLEQEKQKLWDEALKMWQQVLERDPAHDVATKAVNRIRANQKSKKDLEEGRRLFKANQYGEAAKLLRKLKDDSPYFYDAKEELERLQETKGNLIIQVRSLLVKRAKCPQLREALQLLEQCKSIDAKDVDIFELLDTAKQRMQKKRCD